LNAVYPFQKSPRCSATSKRTKKPCMAPAVNGWTVCRFHGARGGAPKGERNGMYRHGLYTIEGCARGTPSPLGSPPAIAEGNSRSFMCGRQMTAETWTARAKLIEQALAGLGRQVLLLTVYAVEFQRINSVLARS
jgi:hypothetical protein